MSNGFFISLEGGEGAGKSTQARRLLARLEAAGREGLLTREPGGSAGAEAIRALVVKGAADRWSPVAETLLLYAAREDHLRRTILPALTGGKVVVCDRFSDSTRAYQGAACGAPPDLIEALQAQVVGEHLPDLTLVFDLPPEVGLARAAARGGDDRFEGKGLEFHHRLRAAFLTIAASATGRCVVIDAAAPPERVEADCWAAVSTRLGLA